MGKQSSNISSFSKHFDFVLVDLVALAIAFVASYWLKFDNFDFVDSGTWKGLFALLLFADLIITLLANPYSGIFRRRYWEDIGVQLILALESFLTICVIFYLFKVGVEFSREMLVTTYITYIALALGLKYIYKRILLARWRNRPPDSVKHLVLVSTRDRALEEEERVYADDMPSTSIVGFGLVDQEGLPELDNRPASSVSHLVELCAATNADEVLILCDPTEVSDEILENLMADGIKIRIGINESLGISSETETVGQVGVIKTLDLERHSFGATHILYLPAKRIVDLAAGILGCAITLPIAGAVKVSYLLSGDSHPIFYQQTRIGQRGKPFKLWKLRSMVWNADEVLQQLLQDPSARAEWERDQKLSNDPRITPIGKFLRRTSLDELPQFINVVKGDMSLIGPRPLVPGELEAHGGRQLYNKVRPGITGWWGCNGRSNIEYYERLELEYYYVTHCSPYLDMLCLFRTVVAVFKKEGAQ